MSIREEQCNKVCRTLDDVLANRPTERDSLIIAVRKAFESLEQLGNSEPLPSAQPYTDEEIRRIQELEQAQFYKIHDLAYQEGKADAMRWISCTDRLPEYGEAVLTINEDEDYEINHIIDEDNGEWFINGAIAWMPLPKPYREE